MRRTTLALATCFLAAASPTPAPNNDSKAIRELDARWQRHVVEKDVASIATLYADDAVFLVPNMPIVQGRQNIGNVWRGMLSTPGFSLAFEPLDIKVSSSGDMALDRGVFRLKSTGPNGPIEDEGKYLVVWRKVEGRWQIAADALNSDLSVR